MSGMMLKSDNAILRKTNRSARNEAVEPLTIIEKIILADMGGFDNLNFFEYYKGEVCFNKKCSYHNVEYFPKDNMISKLLSDEKLSFKKNEFDEHTFDEVKEVFMQYYTEKDFEFAYHCPKCEKRASESKKEKEFVKLQKKVSTECYKRMEREEEDNNDKDVARTKKYKRNDVFLKCKAGYKQRMVQSGLLADFDEPQDLDNEAYLFIWNILGKFDKSKCGEISEFDVPGRTNPKTLEFYFKNYFYGRVNFVACEARDMKKKRGVGPRGVVNDVSYDADYNGEYSALNYEYSATGHIYELLETKNKDFKRFFAESVILQKSQTELREEWGSRYNKLKSELTRFKNDLKRKHYKDYLVEIGKIPKKKVAE